MKHLYFIRHGLSEMNKASRWSGAKSETPLTAEGRAQAKAAGIAAKELGIDYIISSPLNRAYDTAKIIAAEIGYPIALIERNHLLIERDFGSLEGRPWRSDEILDGVTDLEPAEAIIERAHLTLEYLHTRKAESILISSHGTFGRALRHVVNPDIPFGHGPRGYGTPETRLPNGEIVQLL